MKFTPLITGLNTLLLTSAVLAETPSPIKTVPNTAGWEFGLSYGQTHIDTQAAFNADIGDSADVFTLNVQYYFANSPWLLNAGGGSLSYDDKQGYSQTVRNKDTGEVLTKDSSADGTILFIEGGANYPINSALFVQGLVGLDTVFGSSRSIDYCDDCTKKSFDINGGAYGLVKFGGTIADTVEVSLQYQYYLSGDLTSSASLNIGSHFF
ncbi:MAG: hypothetical protein RL497_291 [Pseudomonadota bacterium]|jgi:hypothetical protein